MKQGVYTKIYPFMHRDLGLSGLGKEIFAVIFGFWSKTRSAVRVPYPIIQEITGASVPTISAHLQCMESEGLLQVKREPGKPSMYMVVLPDQVLTDFEAAYGPESTPETEVKSPKAPRQSSAISVNSRQVSAAEAFDDSENTLTPKPPG
ncbi:MAG: helix-turn-helix transcriptional regulator [Bacteroidales bacterium]|nr:helix-turn-helix transcriptional regulator [Bacteroidales bacterium]